ncbi:DUF6600 domain-containing protein [Desulfatitalea tepidiphila]|uniref:DUF6600 domain-containing protein n=1 Tax=Desulfatitalea tepidiphila TaxID=1185843 RepID=UPI00128FC59A|nr:DUF6600 domain-containing protein [Desulfatitalea tepidiphila]
MVHDSMAQEAQTDEIGHTPPRLSFVEGLASYWRPGAEDWVAAQVNTALAPGDQLYVEGEGNLELQIGSQAFVRSGPDTQIGLESQEPDFLQFRVTAGRIALDMRAMGSGQMVAVETPHAAFRVDIEGYFRLDVDDAKTTLSTHRAGRGTLVTESGETIPVGTNTSVTIHGAPNAHITSRTAPPLDDWDQWNYARTDQYIDSVSGSESARYVSSDVYGLSDLDRYGTWRVLPTYGPVWMPRGFAAGWVPYSTGAWVRDPFYGWTWVDSAPWGWAPYHYGRWVYVNSYWCWAPGPRIVRPPYAPALVAFFGVPGVQVSVGIGASSVGWVSLGWGEPLIPWWGRPGFIHRPWWGGWAGPRYVNNRAVHHHTVVNVQNINVYRNTKIRNGMVVVHRDHFGRGPIDKAHRVKTDTHRLRPLHAAPRVSTSSAGFVPSRQHGPRPPDKYVKRPVVDYRRAHSPAKPAIAKPHNNGRRDRTTVHPPSAEPPRPATASGRSPEAVKTNHGRGEPSRMDRPRTPRITSPDDRRQPPVRPSRTPEMRTPPPRTSPAASPNVRQQPPETSGPRVTRTPQTARPQSGTLRFYRKEDSKTGSGEKKRRPNTRRVARMYPGPGQSVPSSAGRNALQRLRPGRSRTLRCVGVTPSGGLSTTCGATRAALLYLNKDGRHLFNKKNLGAKIVGMIDRETPTGMRPLHARVGVPGGVHRTIMAMLAAGDSLEKHQALPLRQPSGSGRNSRPSDGTSCSGSDDNRGTDSDRLPDCIHGAVGHRDAAVCPVIRLFQPG